MSAPSLSVQLITVSIITLQRQLIHNEAVNRNQWNSTYNYIIVGAGGSGGIVAARLTEDPNVNVLLLEAGGPQTIITDMMGNALIGMTGENDWGYSTVHQRRAGFAFKDHRMVFPRGRVLGGSTTTNWAVYNRGNPRDYDNWAHHYGATGWAFNDVLPYFLRTENQTDMRRLEMNREYHSTRGHIPISTVPNPNPIQRRYMEAWNQLGWPTIDVNGASQSGTSLMQQMVAPNNWTRSSTASAFIEPARTRNNLHVVARAFVTRVLLRNTANGLTAYGVEFIRNNNYYSVYASNEVILSAGVINSPKILMQSGIGPRDHLEELNIPVIVDLPVGHGFQDHVAVPIDYLVHNQSDIQWSRNLEEIINVQNLYDYYVNNNGPLIQFPVVLTYLSTRVNDEPDWPDGIIATLVGQLGTNITELVEGYEDKTAWAQYYTPLMGDQKHFYIWYSIYRPRSRGTIRLASNDPKDDPLLDPNYYSDNQDLVAMVDCMSVGMRMAEGEYFRKYANIYPKPIPGCRPCDSGPYYECYSYLACVAQTVVAGSVHPVGTCRMGNSTDPLAVVDNQLRVRGVHSLRVIDASIMPKVPNANTCASSMMIAERGADFVRYGR